MGLKEKASAAKKTEPAKKTKTTPAAPKGDPKKKAAEKALTTTKKTKATPSGPAEKKETAVLTNGAVRRMLEIQFKRQSGNDETRISEEFVEAVKEYLVKELLDHTKNATVVSRYRGLKSTDADAFDLLTLIKFKQTEAINILLYQDNKIESVMKQPMLIEAAK
jgi:hypothetical protein